MKMCSINQQNVWKQTCSSLNFVCMWWFIMEKNPANKRTLSGHNEDSGCTKVAASTEAKVKLTKAWLTAVFGGKEWGGKKLWVGEASRENNYDWRTEEAFSRRLATSSSLCDPKKDQNSSTPCLEIHHFRGVKWEQDCECSLQISFTQLQPAGGKRKEWFCSIKNTGSRETGLVTGNKRVCAKTSLVHNHMLYLFKKKEKVICLEWGYRTTLAQQISDMLEKLCVGLEMTGFRPQRAAGARSRFVYLLSGVCLVEETPADINEAETDPEFRPQREPRCTDRGRQSAEAQPTAWEAEQRWRRAGERSFSESRHAKQICC